jgi:hypothetical protein
MGYHKTEIEKGVYGHFSKIKEEFQELQDAIDQKDKILTLVELSDLIGAIEGFVEFELKLSLNDLVKFKELTKQSFISGNRKS